MRVGVFTPLLANLSLDEAIRKLAQLNIYHVELPTGNYVSDVHCKLSMLENDTQVREFKKKLEDHGVTISALSSHGNPVASGSPAGRA
jgi:sugar phosphate isomerase/epimerase